MKKLLLLVIASLGFSMDMKAKKASFAGFGKISRSTGRIKTKSTHGYFKPSSGYKFVNPYSRS